MSKLEDHIDAPIKKAVIGLSLLGFKTIFSCCGFKYKTENIRKDHFIDKPYVFIDPSSIKTLDKALLFDISVKSGWVIGTGALPQFIDFHGEARWPNGHKWNHPDCLHKAEPSVLAIHRLELALAEQEKDMLSSTLIEDGNYIYNVQRKIRYWQYESSEPWLVTKGMFLNLPEEK